MTKPDGEISVSMGTLGWASQAERRNVMKRDKCARPALSCAGDVCDRNINKTWRGPVIDNSSVSLPIMDYGVLVFSVFL